MDRQKAAHAVSRTPEQVDELRKAILSDPRILADLQKSEEQERQGKPFEPWPTAVD